MEKKNTSKYYPSPSSNHRINSKPERIHREPTARRIDNFNPVKITERSIKKRDDTTPRMNQFENLSGMPTC
jgi:hypothetical protein